MELIKEPSWSLQWSLQNMELITELKMEPLMELIIHGAYNIWNL